MTYLLPACQGLLATVFVVSATAKLRSGRALRGFAASLAAMRLVRVDHARRVAVAVATSEAAVVLLLAVPGVPDAGLVAATGVLSVLSAGVIVVLARGTARPCPCFGTSSSPLQRRHLVRNLLLLCVAVGGLALPEHGMSVVGAVIAGTAGAVIGLLVTVMDDLVALFAPAGTFRRRLGDGSTPGSGRPPVRPLHG